MQVIAPGSGWEHIPTGSPMIGQAMQEMNDQGGHQQRTQGQHQSQQNMNHPTKEELLIHNTCWNCGK